MNTANRSFQRSLRGPAQIAKNEAAAAPKQKKAAPAPSAPPAKLPAIAPKYNPDNSGIEKYVAFRRLAAFAKSKDPELREMAHAMRLFYASQKIG